MLLLLAALCGLTMFVLEPCAIFGGTKPPFTGLPHIYWEQARPRYGLGMQDKGDEGLLAHEMLDMFRDKVLNNCPEEYRITDWSKLFDLEGDFEPPTPSYISGLLGAVLGSLEVENCTRRTMASLKSVIAHDICRTTIM